MVFLREGGSSSERVPGSRPGWFSSLVFHSFCPAARTPGSTTREDTSACSGVIEKGGKRPSFVFSEAYRRGVIHFVWCVWKKGVGEDAVSLLSPSSFSACWRESRARVFRSLRDDERDQKEKKDRKRSRVVGTEKVVRVSTNFFLLFFFCPVSFRSLFLLLLLGSRVSCSRI